MERCLFLTRLHVGYFNFIFAFCKIILLTEKYKYNEN